MHLHPDILFNLRGLLPFEGISGSQSINLFEEVSKRNQPEAQHQYNQLPLPWLDAAHPVACFHHHHTAPLPILV